MNNRILLSLVTVLALSLAACGGATSTQPTVEDKSVGGTTGGTGAQPGVEGQAVEGKAAGEAAAGLLGQRRVHFTFDSSAIDDENRAIVEAHAKYLAANKNIKLVLEGHCDERGTREYNLALGERRAQAVEKMMKLLGVGADRIKVVSYGEEKPLATGHDEASWGQNRRVEILY